jgi:nitroreductase
MRFFKPEPLPEQVLNDVLNVARWTGSARNRQPWELVVIRDRRLLELLAASEGFTGHLENAALGIVLVMAGEPEKFQQETFDEGRLAERISLAAASHGVASSVGWFKGGWSGEGQEDPWDTIRAVGEDGSLPGLPGASAIRCPLGATKRTQTTL